MTENHRHNALGGRKAGTAWVEDGPPHALAACPPRKRQRHALINTFTPVAPTFG